MELIPRKRGAAIKRYLVVQWGPARLLVGASNVMNYYGDGGGPPWDTFIADEFKKGGFEWPKFTSLPRPYAAWLKALWKL